jgi:hypothetical protein
MATGSDCLLVGLIQNAESEIVKLVEDMVLSHIERDCLILVTLPMTGLSFSPKSPSFFFVDFVTDDIECQRALRLAHQVDPDGRRTIGNHIDHNFQSYR